MPLFGQTSDRFLNAPVALVRKRAGTVSVSSRSHDDVDDFLSSDLEISFASNVSLNSPPKDNIALTPDSDYAEPMDISPAPAPPSKSRPRALTSAARLFGNDVSNRLNSTPELQPSPSICGGSTSAKRTQRSALPLEWLMTTKAEPITPDDDAMDVDTSFHIEPPPSAYSFPQAAQSAAPTITSFADAIDNLFYESMSPRRPSESPPAVLPKKRRSLSPDASRLVEDDSSSSPALPSSPAQRKLERKASGSLLSSFGKPTLPGLGNPSVNGIKRPRRPALSAMVKPSDAGLQSAYPIMSAGDDNKFNDPGFPPARRAFSAMIAPAPSSPLGESSGDSSFDMSGEMSSPAQAYAKRQQMKTIRRCDGTDDFRPLTGASAMIMNESPSAKFMVAGGMPGFGDNEAYGKILPCHRVTDDGLMRITAQTMDKLLDGEFDDQIRDFHVIDCRFDYEYSGGHIPGAVNINTTISVEELLLGPSLLKPKPSVSGDGQKKTVLIFHCEFSAKRAPTFAKHLRSKDRAANNHSYPKIYYPELYILEGGYCSYYKRSAHRCEPQGYVCMDDPQHAASRKGDLDQFRKTKFGRHKSYAYGDGAGKLTLASQQTKRNSAPTGGPPALFAAAAGNAARHRRGTAGNGSLSTLSEDSHHATEAEETDIDIGDSPCPAPTKANALKAKKGLNNRAPLSRAETYGPTRMPFLGH
ncbi:hypothetical protein GYMLUDRAFT_74308 [Collybiopsis luxurians FD-317 M1]|uniref:M-phase inducer phosphatase n=1 Tax=Collybiopsis luxurians FD-317 M1 TaxID=944289 RepID=A0A0D0BW99_9AGAR|nr:hypothetical protein GYMLUDRAFT_74308 [Collybiopsis luxurians FD-317 M1]